MTGKVTWWWPAALLAGVAIGILVFGGCLLDDLAVAECPAYDCSQCDVTMGDCLDAGFDLLDGDE